MPVKLASKLSTEGAEARIEIVPLIDIMFFLLASFMLVSLSMVHALTVKVNLPTATTASPDAMKDVKTISIDKDGRCHLEKQPVTDSQLRNELTAARSSKPALRVVINGDRDARHGDVIHILDIVRSAGIDKVGFDVRGTDHPETK
jgi:biopolymer transport protein ExbD